MKKSWTLILLSTVTLLLFMAGCSKNPFFEDKKIGSNKREISGTVQLSDQSTPDNVFVWLEGFNLSTRTDSLGKFTLTLPTPAAQPGGGLDGIFKLYFYVANYDLSSAQVVVHGGQLESADSDLDDKGELKTTQTLSRRLRIQVAVTPSAISAIDSVGIDIAVILQADHEPVVVRFPKMLGNNIAAIFLRDIDPANNYMRMIDNAGYLTKVETVGTKSREWHMIINYSLSMFPVGEYEVIPYLFIEQENIPAELSAALGTGIEDFSESYLKIPFKRQGGRLTIFK